MRRLRATALRVRVLLLIALVLTPLLGLTLWSVFELRDAGKADAEAKARELATAIGGEHARSFDGTAQLLMALGQLTAVRSGNGCPEALAEIRDADPRYANLGVIGPEGFLICSALPVSGPIDLRDRAYFQRAVESGEFAIGDYQIGRATGTASINFGLPVYDEAGELFAVVFAALDLSSFASAADSIDFPDGTTVTLIDGDGVVLARHPDGPAWIGRVVPLPPFAEELRFPGELRLSEAVAGTTEDGVDAAVAIRAASEAGAVYLSVSLPKSAALAHADATLRNGMITIVVIAILGGGFAWWATGLFVIAPVNRLSAASAAIASGRLGARAPERGPSELSDLARSFNEMASSVQATMADLQEAKETKRAVIDASPLAIVAIDLEGRVTLWNPAAEQILGWSADEIIGELNPIPEDDDAYEMVLDFCRRGRSLTGIEVNGRTKRGETVEISLSTAPVRDMHGEISGMMAIMTDLTATRARERTIRRLETSDALTGLPNRTVLEERLASLIKETSPESPSTLAILSIDDLDMIISTYGRVVGDEMVRTVAESLHQPAARGAFVAGLGSGDFGIVLVEVGTDDAEAIIDEIRARIDARNITIDDGVIESSTSAGIAVIDGSVEAGRLLALADAALYEARARGRRQTVTYRSEDDREGSVVEENRWATRIREALQDDRFVLHFQPIVRVASGKPTSYEALLRMRMEDGTLVAPHMFLPAGERFGLLPDIDRRVVGKAIALLEQRPELRLFVNLSGASLADDHFLGFVRQRLEGAHHASGRLVFELTETVAIRDFARVREFMGTLRRYGCGFALDDFGAGFSSFAYLDALPVDYLKIDGSLIRRLPDDASTRAIVDAITRVARALDAEPVAEWVESPEVAAVVRSLDISFGQGYFWGEPGTELPGPLALAS